MFKITNDPRANTNMKDATEDKSRLAATTMECIHMGDMSLVGPKIYE